MIMQKIYYNGDDITSDFTLGKWQHPDTGVKYPANWDATAIEGITIEEVIPTPYVPSLAEQAESVRYALQESIDIKAQSFGFSSGNALMLYASAPNAFQPLALAFLAWEANVWVDGYS
jgi:hypothetical protein